MNTEEVGKKNHAEFMKQKATELINLSASAVVPAQLGEYNAELTSIKAYFSEKLDDIIVFKNTFLEEKRIELGKANAARMAWGATDHGRNEVLLRGIIGRIKDTVSTNNQRIRIKHDEAYGQY